MANEKRLISYDVLMKHLDSCIKEGKGLSKSVCVAIKCFVEQMATVDAVEVVRCKDCKHSTLPAVLTQRYGKPGTLTCHNAKSPCNKRNVKSDGFCPYGERRTDGKSENVR